MIKRIPTIIVTLVVVTAVAFLSVIGLNGLTTPEAYDNTCLDDGTYLKYVKAIEALDSTLALTSDPIARENLDTSRLDVKLQMEEDRCTVPTPSESPTEEPTEDPSEDPSESASPTEDPTDDPSATPTPTPSASPSVTPAVSSDTWTPHWYTLDPAKTAARNFGPPVIASSTEDAIRQWYERMTNDPSLLCEDGGLVVAEASYMDCVKQVMSSKTARDGYVTKVKQHVAKIEVVDLPAVKASKSAYMVMGDDGIPRLIAITVPRYEEYRALKVTTTDGRVYYFRFLCGFQWDEPQVAEATPVVTERDNPPTRVQECVNGGDRDDNGRCVPPRTAPKPKPSSTPSTTPPASPKPSPTPTVTPSPTPSKTPPASPKPSPTPSTTPPTSSTPTPSCVNKECETPVAPPSNHPPAASPTSTRESVAPVEPSPADPSEELGDPVDIPAESATPAPEPTEAIPTATNAIEPTEASSTYIDAGR